MNGIRSVFAVNRTVSEEIWIPSAGKAKGASDEVYRLNKSLEKIVEDINEIVRLFELQKIPITPELVRNELLGINKQYKFLLEAYEDHNKRMEALVGKQYAPKTLAKHKTSIKFVKEFLTKVYKTNDIELNKVNHQFLMNYEFFLKTNKIARQHNSVITYIKNLGKIIHLAHNNGWMENNPLNGYKFKYQEIDKPFLSQEELEKIRNKKFSIPRLEKIRDVFLFCCYTGLAFIDVKELKATDFITDARGEQWIRKRRRKTRNWSNIPVLRATLTS
jgi:integrase